MLVMDYVSGSSSIPSCFSSSKQAHANPNEVTDVGCSNKVIDFASWLPHYTSYEWVNPHILDVPTSFKGCSALYGFLSKVSMLKSNYPLDVVATDSCNHTDRVCHGRENGCRDLFFVYTCLFNNLHISLPFDEFTMGVRRILNVALTQLHPNSWAALQAFRLICDALRLRPSPQFFCFIIIVPSCGLTFFVESSGKHSFFSLYLLL